MREQLTRKERERQARSDLFLDIAKRIIGRGGFHELSMNGIAEIAEYSKGTIYLHYPSREVVLMALCRRGLTHWKDMVSRVLASDLSAYDKVFGLHWAHVLYAARYPVEYDGLSLVRASSIREKIGEEDHAALQSDLNDLIGSFQTVIKEGVEAGEVALSKDLTPDALALAFWSLCRQPYIDGIADSDPINVVEDAGKPGDPALIHHALLQGIGWKSTADKRSLRVRLLSIRDRLFADEVADLTGPSSSS